MLALGAGGSTTALVLHFSRKQETGDRPRRMVIVNRSPGRLETDVLGQLPGLPGVHFVDASVFPSIPATTPALFGRTSPATGICVVIRQPVTGTSPLN